MRGYHICIALQRPSHPSPGATETDFVPIDLFQQFPSHTPKSTSRRHALYNYNNKDYRFGPLRVDWTDMTMESAFQSGKARQGPPTATFVSNPNTTSGSSNLPEGVIHIYRDSPDPDVEQTVANYPPDSGVMLAVLAVPPWMTPSDFLAFVSPAAQGISHLRMIRDSSPNRSIVVIKFPNSADAAEFIESYNGKPFNAIDPETCHVVKVNSVKIECGDDVSQAISRVGLASPSTYELPTCPVCLERMDSTATGLVTVPCSHTFHCMCLSKWGDSRCPVCRYSQTLLTSHPTPSSRSAPIPFAGASDARLSKCSSCASTTNLWICLICGNIGCGRYGRAHAQAHYELTTHLYALELETQRVWDYAGDGYVHRLIQNKADGKLVELPSAAMTGTIPREEGVMGRGGPSTADALSAEKIEAIGIEYSYLLTSQLDSQREYYEEQTSELQKQVQELKYMVETLSQQVEVQSRRRDEEETRRAADEKARLAILQKEKAKVESKADKMAELARKIDKELKEERAVSEGLMRNLANMKEKATKVDQERQAYEAKIKDLEEQLRDVMFFLEANAKIEKGEGVAAEAAGIARQCSIKYYYTINE
ncbi:zf-UBP-domain-containing protein [Fistulina hepatica ATCC 64428]|uniref:Zf-UBP-domain-containing protein n=1 Tax=Fistulina hepatica ATCC 64428 TaxID=1128425 RepID=A0A0D7ABC7_9AGAR|nr:zf-UBP-domain-containing protein [Fistulina hepatica ATCC 64428]